MIRALRTLATGLVAATAVAWTAACGIPDAGPVLETMESQARERGLSDRVRYSATSDGTPGTMPTMMGPREEATPAGFTELVDLLQDNLSAARTAGYDTLNGNVVSVVGDTEIQMRTVPGPATQEVLEALIDPGVTRMEVNSPDTLVLEVWPERYRTIASLAPQLTQALEEGRHPGVVRISPVHTDSALHLHPGGLTEEVIFDSLLLADRMRAAAGEMYLPEIHVREGRIDRIQARHETIEPQFITALAQVAPDGTGLSVGRHDAVIGGESGEPPASEEERVLRELVEHPS